MTADQTLASFRRLNQRRAERGVPPVFPASWIEDFDPAATTARILAAEARRWWKHGGRPCLAPICRPRKATRGGGGWRQ